MSEKAELSLFRARQKYFEEGDKAGRLLARYINQREAMSSISVIRHGTGQLVSEPHKINAVFSDYYKNLYSSESLASPESIKKFLLDLNLPRVTKDQLKGLDSPITTEEIVEKIKHLPSSKAPGLAGFTSDFYKAFPQELSPLLLSTYNPNQNLKTS